MLQVCPKHSKQSSCPEQSPDKVERQVEWHTCLEGTTHTSPGTVVSPLNSH
jgi:hypothetical protein